MIEGSNGMVVVSGLVVGWVGWEEKVDWAGGLGRWAGNVARVVVASGSGVGDRPATLGPVFERRPWRAAGDGLRRAEPSEGGAWRPRGRNDGWRVPSRRVAPVARCQVERCRLNGTGRRTMPGRAMPVIERCRSPNDAGRKRCGSRGCVDVTASERRDGRPYGGLTGPGAPIDRAGAGAGADDPADSREKRPGAPPSMRSHKPQGATRIHVAKKRRGRYWVRTSDLFGVNEALSH